MQAITQRQIHFVPDGERLSTSAAEAFVNAVENAITHRGVAAVALCGGRTTRKLFELLTDEPYATRLEPLWARLHVFWTTERHVQPDHPESCYRLAHWSLLSRFAIPSANVHRIRAEMADGASAATAYQHELRTFFQPRGLMRDGLPCFDLTILALDDHDGLVSVESTTGDTRCWVTTCTPRSRERGEIGLTLSVLRNARSSLVLCGNDAAAAGRAAHLLRFVA
jgi:6-phosphogluconolactonase